MSVLGEDTKDASDLSTISRILLSLALLTGAGSGVSWITADTEDRYKGKDAVKDFKLRDERHAALKEEFHEHRAQCASRHRELEQEINELKLRQALLRFNGTSEHTTP